MSSAAISATSVAIKYGQLVAVRHASVEVAPGDLIGISGANGAGKSTLLKALAGVLPQADGAIRYSAPAASQRHLRGSVRAGIALVPEGRELFNGLTVRDNLLIGAVVARRRRTGDRLAFIVDLFPRLGERMAQNVETLSGGEKQMVAVGRALMSEPEILLVDELSLGLAPIVATTVMQTLVELNRTERLTTVIVDESLARLNRHVDRLFFMRDGVLSGELTAEGRSDAVSELYFSKD